ncbi:hypothetical protein [Microbacterium oleivorans]|uniref:Uncharacterized protein n=1 Tax=Microbacterium oleivorans TaxID=273677 RepID=A0A7D5JC87_9MICO|nr:hypothetical protein [Microbacterium oleivorans]QLD10640.1 hypothetical protein HW566_01900 [Microbacterium oleivorans]
MSSSSRVTRSFSRVRLGAVVSGFVGAVLLLTAVVLDWSGFWGGFAQGAGVVLLLTAAYLLGLLTGMRRSAVSPTWLPAGGGEAA